MSNQTPHQMGMAMGNVAMSGQLAQMAQQMNGHVEGVRGEDRLKQQAAAHGLSGAEYLKALALVRAQLAQRAEQAGQMHVVQDASQRAVLGREPDTLKSQKAPDFAAVSMLGGPAGFHQHGTQTSHMVQLSGNVVPGEMARNQLTHAAIVNMTSGIHSLATNGGGEMRIRLKPDNLGELRLRISTQGNEVGLQIQASDEKAKKVLEESLSSLKDSLASQSLTLGKVAINVAQMGQSHGSHLGGDNSGNSGQFQQNGSNFGQQFGQGLGQSAGDGGRRFASSAFSGGSVRGVGLQSNAVGSMSSASGGRSTAADGRLDVMA